jgi:hypothetical protein
MSRIPTGFRFVAPILLGGCVIGIIASAMWLGGKRESLAAYAEARLLQLAVKFSSEPAQLPSPIVVVSAVDSDLASLSEAPHSLLRDAHITEYAELLEKVNASNPKLIVLSWLSNAHPLTADYLRPLTDTIDRLGISSKTILAIHFFSAGVVPEELTRKYQISEARDCYYDINTFCTLNPEWTWMPQRMADLFWAKRKPWTVSTNLPHTLPNFVLNLPDLNSIPKHTFMDFKTSTTKHLPADSVVFIGNDITQDFQFRSNKDLLQKTFVAAQSRTRSLLSDGVPFHVFWAGMVQMFIENKMVAVVPAWISNFFVIGMCLIIVISIKRLKGLALGPFMLCALGLPLMNAISLKYLQVYLPVVNIISAGFAMFIAATFISVSVYSYQRSRASALEGLAAETADIKTNFISLISHNLNTPIAQLRGLLDVLAMRHPLEKNGPLESALILLEYMRLTVRAVLDTSMLLETPSVNTPSAVSNLWNAFLDWDELFFKRIGVKCTLTPAVDDDGDGEIWYYKFTLDVHSSCKTLTYLILFIHLNFRVRNLEVRLIAKNPEPANPLGLIIEFHYDQAQDVLKPPFLPAFALKALRRYLDTAMITRDYAIVIDRNSARIGLRDRCDASINPKEL